MHYNLRLEEHIVKISKALTVYQYFANLPINVNACLECILVRETPTDNIIQVTPVSSLPTETGHFIPYDDLFKRYYGLNS